MNNRLSEFRFEKGLSQKNIAKDIGVTTSHYGMLEIGTRKPSLTLAYKLAKYFEKTIEEIFFKELNN